MSLADISEKFDESTLDEIIRKAGGTRHTAFKFGEGFKKGDSYLSQSFRLCVYGVNDNNSAKLEVNLIVKSMPDNLARRKLFRSATFFRNEINFYTKVVPAWEKFQSERKPVKPFKEYPTCYASLCDGENDFIALGDLSVLGYGSPNRQEFISLESCLVTMRTLGRFHGISLAFKAIDPKGFEIVANQLEETYYTKSNRSWYIGFLESVCKVAKDAVQKTYPNTKYETISENFLTPETLYDDLIQLVSSKSKLSVIGHGDCWSQNFLIRYNKTGEPEAITIIDFQLARYASIVLDLSFFIYSCASEELLENNFETILKAYHESACELIKDLGAEPENVFSWQDLLNEMQEFARFGCGMGIESLPLSLIEDSDLYDLDAIVENTVLADVWHMKPFQDAKKRERIAQIFKHSIDLGYIK